MSASAAAKIAASFLVAGFAVWLAPVLLDLAGVGEFAFVGQAVLAILALSVTERAFRSIG